MQTRARSMWGARKFPPYENFLAPTHVHFPVTERTTQVVVTSKCDPTQRIRHADFFFIVLQMSPIFNPIAPLPDILSQRQNYSLPHILSQRQHKALIPQMGGSEGTQGTQREGGCSVRHQVRSHRGCFCVTLFLFPDSCQEKLLFQAKWGPLG